MFFFYIPFAEPYDPTPESMQDITANTDTTTIAWFSDDHFRFDNHTSRWAKCFDYSVTTDQASLPKYAAIHYDRVILSQWACNHFLYRNKHLPLTHEVTFVGQAFPHRQQAMAMLSQQGIPVKTWGKGWDENSRIDQDAMIDVFNQSRINLNLAASGHFQEFQPPPATWQYRARSWAAKVPGLRAARDKLRSHPSVCATVPASGNTPLAAAIFPLQIKGRNFEVPGCGGFLLTESVPHLENYYAFDKEIACYASLEELKDKLAYYLNHEEERAAIANAGYQRTLKEHTYVHRFTHIFRTAGLCKDGEIDLSARSGKITDIAATTASHSMASVK